MGARLTTYTNNKGMFKLKNDAGITVFEGSLRQIGNQYDMTREVVYKYYAEGKKIGGEYTIYKATEDFDYKAEPESIQEHLFTPDGNRRYDRKKGYPNRYKDAGCVRFTPL